MNGMEKKNSGKGRSMASSSDEGIGNGTKMHESEQKSVLRVA